MAECLGCKAKQQAIDAQRDAIELVSAEIATLRERVAEAERQRDEAVAAMNRANDATTREEQRAERLARDVRSLLAAIASDLDSDHAFCCTTETWVDGHPSAYFAIFLGSVLDSGLSLTVALRMAGVPLSAECDALMEHADAE